MRAFCKIKNKAGKPALNSPPLPLNLEGLVRFVRQMRPRQRHLPYASVRILAERFCIIGNEVSYDTKNRLLPRTTACKTSSSVGFQGTFL